MTMWPTLTPIFVVSDASRITHSPKPGDFLAPDAPLPEEAPSASSPDSDDSLTDESVDTASEEEKITVETLNNSHERMDT